MAELANKRVIITGAASGIGRATAVRVNCMRTGKPRDIAHAAVFFSSERAAQITGQNLVVDGGASVGDKVDQVALTQEEFKKLMS